MTLPRLLAVGGPTAAGKTPLAIVLARAFDGEIVNADSRQIYRGMSIGTAKPSAIEQGEVPHHVLDIVNPDEAFSLALYAKLAHQAIAEISGRNRLPILVGGTGLYLRAVVEGYAVPEVPPNLELRARLGVEAADRGVGYLTEYLHRLDPEASAHIDGKNTRRLIRAIEVTEALGRPFSQLQRNEPAYDSRTIVLCGARATLFARADARLEAMLAAGFEAEVATLLSAGFALQLPSMTALGYREFGRSVQGLVSREEAVTATRTATRAFIKRQTTWFRAERTDCRLDVEDPRLSGDAGRFVDAWLHERQ